MTDVFLRIVELSWQAGVLALAVMLARLALRRAPKWAVCLLWVLVAVRLVLPVSLQSPVSLQAAQSPVTAALYEQPQRVRQKPPIAHIGFRKSRVLCG